MMTKQEMFDRAWRGLAAQQWKKSKEEGEGEGEGEGEDEDRCLYNGEGGKRCGWGHIDPIGTADPRCEGKTVAELGERGVGLAAYLNSEMLAFAVSIQAVHDDACEGDIRGKMLDLAYRSGLVIPDLL